MNEKRMNNRDNSEIDLLELAGVYLRKWWMIALGAIIGAIIAMAVTMCLITPRYQSTAMLYMVKTNRTISMSDLQLGDALSGDFAVIAKSKPVIDSAIERMKEEENKTFTRSEIQGMVSISTTSRILSVQVTAADPSDACIIANTMAEAISEQVAEIMKADPPTMVEKAEPSTVPVSPSVRKNTMKGFLVGMFLVCAVLTVLFLMNDSIKTQEDVEKYLNVPTLAVIPYISDKERRKSTKMSAVK